MKAKTRRAVAYYNEIDPRVAAWIRELIKARHIPAGEVDERSIVDVKETELSGFTQYHFFAGIGGWPRALRLAGWPDDRPVCTGSCPCPPFSCAGKGQLCPNCQGRHVVPHPFKTGVFVCVQCEKEWYADARHLWPELRRLIEHRRFPAIFGEQVASADGRVWLSGVRVTLEQMGYAVGGSDLCAAGIGAPHIRQRLFWVAYSNDGGCAAGRGEGSEGSQRKGRVGIPEQRGGHGGLANTERHGGRADKPRRRSEGGAFAGRACSTGGLADAKDPNGRSQQQPRGTWSGRRGSAGGSKDVGLADSQSGRFGADRRPPWITGHSDQRSASGLAQPNEQHDDRAGSVSGDDGGERKKQDAVFGERSDAGGMGHSERQRREGKSFTVLGSTGEGHWSDHRWIPCRDGKARRVKPGLPLLANGVPARVVRLRGYGNAILPILGAEFIQAAEEARRSIVMASPGGGC
jgi:DNA (cytosine-5)-methyltransferase 1